jgi:hypothetical protein
MRPHTQSPDAATFVIFFFVTALPADRHASADVWAKSFVYLCLASSPGYSHSISNLTQSTHALLISEGSFPSLRSA